MCFVIGEGDDSKVTGKFAVVENVIDKGVGLLGNLGDGLGVVVDGDGWGQVKLHLTNERQFYLTMARSSFRTTNGELLMLILACPFVATSTLFIIF